MYNEREIKILYHIVSSFNKIKKKEQGEAIHPILF